MTNHASPLAGIKVLEMGALVAAPFCGMLLADMGAEVIKLEPPEGDMARQFAPFVSGESAFFMAVNRGKRGLILNLKEPQDLASAREIASHVDVVIHNYRTGVADRLGLAYPDLHALHPGLVYCAVSGYGPSGPMASRPGVDLLFQAESGMLAVTGSPNGLPVKVGTNAADVYAATTAAFAITAALLQRERTGKGSEVHVALRDAFVALQACWVSSYLATGEQPQRLGSGSPFTAPTDIYRAQDGDLVLAVVNDMHWQILCKALGLADLISDPRLATNDSRVQHAEYLRTRVNEALAHRNVQEWINLLDVAGVPVGRVLDYGMVCDDPQIQHNEMVLELNHSLAGTIKVQGSPIWMDSEKCVTKFPPPALGEHSQEILYEYGCIMGAEQISDPHGHL